MAQFFLMQCIMAQRGYRGSHLDARFLTRLSAAPGCGSTVLAPRVLESPSFRRGLGRALQPSAAPGCGSTVLASRVLEGFSGNKKRASLLYRAASTRYPCFGQDLGDSRGAGRIGLTRLQKYCFSRNWQNYAPIFGIFSQNESKNSLQS